MTPARKRIAARFARALVAYAAAGGLAAIASPDFREFVGDATVYAIVTPSLAAAIQAAGKWARERK